MGDVTIISEDVTVVFTDPQVIALKPATIMWDKARDIVEELHLKPINHHWIAHPV